MKGESSRTRPKKRIQSLKLFKGVRATLVVAKSFDQAERREEKREGDHLPTCERIPQLTGSS